MALGDGYSMLAADGPQCRRLILSSTLAMSVVNDALPFGDDCPVYAGHLIDSH